MHADNPEREIDDGARARLKHTSTPERRAQRKTPLRAAEPRLELAHLKQPHRVFVAVRHNAVAETVARQPLVVNFADEPMKAVYRTRQRRHELGDFVGAQHGQQSLRVALAHFAQRDLLGTQRRKTKMPVESARLPFGGARPFLVRHFLHSDGAKSKEPTSEGQMAGPKR